MTDVAATYLASVGIESKPRGTQATGRVIRGLLAAIPIPVHEVPLKKGSGGYYLRDPVRIVVPSSILAPQRVGMILREVGRHNCRETGCDCAGDYVKNEAHASMFELQALAWMGLARSHRLALGVVQCLARSGDKVAREMAGKVMAHADWPRHVRLADEDDAMSPDDLLKYRAAWVREYSKNDDVKRKKREWEAANPRSKEQRERQKVMARALGKRRTAERDRIAGWFDDGSWVCPSCGASLGPGRRQLKVVGRHQCGVADIIVSSYTREVAQRLLAGESVSVHPSTVAKLAAIGLATERDDSGSVRPASSFSARCEELGIRLVNKRRR